VESDGLGLDFALLDIDLVTTEDDWDVLTNTDEVTCGSILLAKDLRKVLKLRCRPTVPVGDVLVGDTRGYIEHDDTALTVDVVSVTKTTELLLSSSIPDIELDLTEVLRRVSPSVLLFEPSEGDAYGGETKRVNFDTQCCDVLLFELSSQMTLDEGGLSRAH